MSFLTGRDTDLLILEKLNDRDLLNICLINKEANKLCNNEIFWRKRFLKKWGTTEIKPESWKKFYLTTLKYLDGIILDKNMEKYRKDNYKAYLTNDNRMERALLKAVKNGEINIIKLILEKGNTEHLNFNNAMYLAAENGDINIVNLMIENGARNFNKGLIYAANGGHNDIVRLMIDNGANEIFINTALRNAAAGNHLDTVKLLVKRGADDFNTALSVISWKDFDEYKNMRHYLMSQKI
jgi:ankyrin repeat protein